MLKDFLDILVADNVLLGRLDVLLSSGCGVLGMMEGRLSEYCDSGTGISDSSDMGDGDREPRNLLELAGESGTNLAFLLDGVLRGEGRFCLSDRGDPLTLVIMSSLFLDLGVDDGPCLKSPSGVTLILLTFLPLKCEK